LKNIGKLIALLFLVTICGTTALSQSATVTGTVSDEGFRPLVGANVFLQSEPNKGTSTKRDGSFSISVKPNIEQTVVITYLGYDTLYKTFNLNPGETKNIDIQLTFGSRSFKQVIVEDERTRTSTMSRIDPKSIDQLPMPNASIEKTLLFQGMGVSSSNELSSQYSVRGGSFDENLIYVNDVEVYRPFLVRSGQQEGLSFINPKLVRSVEFSSGGFEAQYGDKMSSVLDVHYKKPKKKLAGSVEGSLLGGNIHLENASDNYRFTQLHGFRYRTNQYVLNSLDTEGSYKPSFTDYQGYFTYDLTDDLELGLLLNYAKNEYNFIPQDRETDFGTINEALRLKVFFDGQEINEYETGVGALTATWQPTNKLRLKFITSAYRTLQQENFDVEGAYRLDELNRDLGSDDFGEVAFSRGTGGYINHARNYLLGNVFAAAHKGTYYGDKYTVRWGLRGKHERIEDEFNEWRYVDSSGYSLPNAAPFTSRDDINLYEVIRARNNINSSRLMGYGQLSRALTVDSNEFSFNVGGRFHYWDFNDELVGGPRALFTWKPNWEKDILFKAASGFYYQPPFYREMRDLNGDINYDIKAQRAIHYLVGMDYVFEMWDRPFKFATEAYYKQLDNLIPYEIDNVRLRYYAENNAKGYATGIDFKINGEFVKGVQSWASLSIMSTKEDIKNDFYYEYYDDEGNRTYQGNQFRPITDSVRKEPGYIPRPTDQRVNFSLFFQDYFPGDPTIKMNLNIVFGTGLPFGPPSYDRYQDTLRIPPYRRVDVGFSKQLLRDEKSERKGLGLKGPFKHLHSVWLSAEVFNMLAINNTISYLWVRDISNRQYGIPNYLTGRQLNVRLIVNF
jgi:hypothetical protein